MTLTLNNGKTVEIRKYTREFNGRMPKNDIINITVEWSPTVFDEMRDLLTEENTSHISILDDDGVTVKFDEYVVDNMVEINGLQIHDVAIRLQKDHIVTL